MSKESVAAIIPTKDRPNYVGRAINSVLEQSYPDIEIIIVDDSQNSETQEVVNDLRCQSLSKDITYIRNQEPQGVSTARNQAIEKTDSDLIAFLDDDDIWHPKKTEKQVARLHELDSSFGAVYSGFNSVDSHGQKLHTKVPEYTGDIYRYLLTQDIIGPPSTVMIRREVIDSVGGFDETFDHHEDWELYLRLARFYKFAANDTALIQRTIHEDATSTDIQRAKNHRERLLNKYELELKRHGIHSQAWAAHFRKSGIMSCRRGEIKRGRRNFRTSLGFDISVSTLLLYLSTLLGQPGFDAIRRAKQLVVINLVQS